MLFAIASESIDSWTAALSFGSGDFLALFQIDHSSRNGILGKRAWLTVNRRILLSA